MPIEIRMRLTDSMTEGVVVAWRKREGEPVRAGEVIAEIQADKTTVDFEAPDDGTLGRIVTPAGAEAVKVGDVLAILHRPGEVPSPAAHGSEAPCLRPYDNGNSRPDEKAGPATATADRHIVVPRSGPRCRGPGRCPREPTGMQHGRAGRLDLSRLSLNGPRGRITMADVLTELGVEPRPANALPPGVTAVPDPRHEQPETDAPFDELPHSQIRQVIARRLGASKQTIPHFYLTTHCGIERAASVEGRPPNARHRRVRALDQ